MPVAPTDFPDLELWLDASDADTVTGTSSVTQWNDKSGNDRHFYQSDATRQPRYGFTTQNGLNTMHFNPSGATSKSLINPDKTAWNFLVASPGCTIYEVSKPDCDSNGGASFGNVDTAGGSTSGLRNSFGTGSNPNMGMVVYRNGNIVVNSNMGVGHPTDDAWAVRRYTFVPNSSTGLSLQYNTFSPSVSTTGNHTQTANQHYMTVGGAGASSTSGGPTTGQPLGTNGLEVAELIIFSGPDPGILNYLNNKWAAYSLASDVPFIQGNDRYQVVVLAKQGTSTVAPEFRYWYAGPPEWEGSLA